MEKKEMTVESAVEFLISHFSQQAEVENLKKLLDSASNPAIKSLIEREIASLSKIKKVPTFLVINVDTSEILPKYQGNKKSPNSWESFPFTGKELFEKLFSPPVGSYSAPRELRKIFGNAEISALPKDLQKACSLLKEKIKSGQYVSTSHKPLS